MATTVDTVRELSHSEVIAVTAELLNLVYQEIPYREVRENFAGVEAVDSLVMLDESALQRELSAADSARLGRLVLQVYARDDALEPLVWEAIEKVRRRDDLIVGVILAVDLVVKLTLLVATTKAEIRSRPDGTIAWSVRKGAVSPEVLAFVVEPVADAASAAAGGEPSECFPERRSTYSTTVR